ncbi:MAG TPA: universal stress protein [Terriglobia bacterium]|nr:universal stress protein [Terriglobia bacterium]
MLRIQKILVPTDFSDCSVKAVKYATELASVMKAKLYLLHVAEHSNDGGDPQSSKYIVPEYISEVEKQLKDRLNRIANELNLQGVEAQPMLVAGRAYADIVNTAEELGVDLIVIATHGRTGFSHLVFGSTAEKVVRLSPCPVLTVKSQPNPLAA